MEEPGAEQLFCPVESVHCGRSSSDKVLQSLVQQSRVGPICDRFSALFAVFGVRGLGLQKHNLRVGLEEREGSGSCSRSHGQGKRFLPPRLRIKRLN